MWRCTKVWTLCKKHLIINMNGNLYSNWVTIFVLGVGERISLQLEYMGMRKRRMDRPVPMMRVNRAVESPARCLGIKHWICYNVEESWHLGFGHLAHYRPQFHKKEPHTPPPPPPFWISTRELRENYKTRSFTICNLWQILLWMENKTARNEVRRLLWEYEKNYTGAKYWEN